MAGQQATQRIREASDIQRFDPRKVARCGISGIGSSFLKYRSAAWQRRRPPRPVVPSGTNRLLPTAGFSLSELDDAGINLDIAERLGLPIDAVRIGAYGPNVSALRDFARSARQPS